MIWATLLFSTALAEEALTYEEALRTALEANPSLQRARLDSDSAVAGVRSAQGFLDPSLSVDGSWRSSQSKGFFQGFPFTSKSRSWNLGTALSHTLGTGTTYALNASMDRNASTFITDFGVGEQEQEQDAYTSNLNVSVTQQLLEGFRTAYNLQNVTAARQNVERQELNLEKARQDALSQTATAYWNWVYQVQLHTIATESVQVAEEALRVGRLQLETGQLAPVEETRLEAALVQSQKSELDAAIAARKAADDLALLIGLAPGVDRLPASKAGEPGPLALDAAKATDVALAQNLDLMLARAEVSFAEASHANARHALLPNLSATASAGVGAQQDTIGGAVTGLTEPEAFPFVSVSGQFSMPLGNRSARGAAEQAGIQVAQQARTVLELERSVAAQVVQQVRLLESARKRIELMDANQRLARQTLAAEEALAEAGRSIQKTVLEARAEVTRSAAEAAKARTDYRLAQTELLRLQGQLDVDAL